LEKGKEYRLIVIGTSAGGLYALSAILNPLPADYPFPIVVVQHRSKEHNELLEEVLQVKCKVKIKQADEKEPVRGGVVYIAPPDYHLLVEKNFTLSLTADAQVLYSRPSIDVLFESAAIACRDQLIGIILTGANSDGATGINEIKKHNGITIAQDPQEADFPYMPQAAINGGKVMHIWTLKEINTFLMTLTEK
jgi:two-component system, chemotaxis family, protein-glutamate methylesterase/glutaminase